MILMLLDLLSVLLVTIDIDRLFKVRKRGFLNIMRVDDCAFIALYVDRYRHFYYDLLLYYLRLLLQLLGFTSFYKEL